MNKRTCLSACLGLAVALAFAPIARSADFPEVIAKLKPRVVIVGTTRPTDSPRFRLRGTGFVVGDGNWVITNAHVLPDSSEDTTGTTLVVQVRQPDNSLQERAATLLERDGVYDMALLRIEGPPVPAFVVRDSATVREGLAVAFMGFPIGGALGFSTVTHRAVISSIASQVLPFPTSQQLSAKTIRAIRAGPFDIFQLDGTAYPGNSGGPLFDAATGELVGVINMVLIKGTRESALTHPTGISYAIPSRFVLEIMQRNR